MLDVQPVPTAPDPSAAQAAAAFLPPTLAGRDYVCEAGGMGPGPDAVVTLSPHARKMAELAGTPPVAPLSTPSY